MNRILRRANMRLSLGSAAFLLAGSSMAGTILGILRTKLINANFNNFSTGAYFAAFKIPDFIFFTLAAGALSVAFLPVLSDKLAKGNRQDAWLLASYVINVIAIIMFFFSLVLIIFPRPILEHLIAPGFSPERLDVAASIMRLVAINPLLFSISSILASVQQAVGRFFFFAVAPILYNTAIIVSIYVFRDSLGIVGLGVGVAIGAVLNLILVSFGMYGLNFRHTLKINFKNKSFRAVMRALPPRSIDQGVTYINGIAQTRFASRVSIDAVTNFENALLLQNAPVTLIGSAISTAAFPRFTERISQGRPDLFRKEFLSVLRVMIWIAIPVIATSYFTREHLARIIFARDNRDIALIFGFLVVGMFFRTLYSIITRFYYAQKDTITPLVVSLFIIALNIYLSWQLALNSSYGVSGLAIAASTVAAVEVFILLLVMVWRDPHLFHKQFMASLATIFSVAAFATLGAYLFAKLLPLNPGDSGLTLLVKVSIIGLLTSGVHLLVSWLFGVDEAKPVVQRIRKTILRPIKIQ